MNKFLERFGIVLLGAIILLTSLLLKGCEQGEQIVPTFDRTGSVVNVTVEIYDTVRQVQDHYRQVHKLPRSHDLTGLQGFAVWYEWPSGKPENTEYTCDIHVAQPHRVDDNNTLTLGHEFLHCIYGSYHRDKH